MSIFPKKDIKLKNNNRSNIHELIEIVVIVGTFCIFCSSLCNTIFSIDIQYPWNYENANIIFQQIQNHFNTIYLDDFVFMKNGSDLILIWGRLRLGLGCAHTF